LTKIHEEFLRGTVAEARRELASRDRIRGEITLLWKRARCQRRGPRARPQPACPENRRPHRPPSGRNRGDEKDALKRLARELGQSKSDLYRELQRERARRR